MSKWINWLCSSVRSPLLVQFNQWSTMYVLINYRCGQLCTTTHAESACKESTRFANYYTRSLCVKFYRVCANRLPLSNNGSCLLEATRNWESKVYRCSVNQTCIREGSLKSASKQTTTCRITTLEYTRGASVILEDLLVALLSGVALISSAVERD